MSAGRPAFSERGAVLDDAAAAAWREDLRRADRTVIFTNGCFDVLHAGHVRYLRQARAFGDALVVGLNGDLSVRALKGAGRPVNSQHDRAEVLAALRAVDAVVVFPEKRATRLIRLLQPDVYVKGGDYTEETLDPDERAALREAGARIEILPLVPGRSTTAILERVGSPGRRPTGKHAPAPEGDAPDGLSNSLRIGILGSGKGSNFEAICRAIESGSLSAVVAAAFSDRADSRFLEIARGFGIPAAAVDYGVGAEAAERELRDGLVGAGVEIVVLAGFMRVLKGPLLESFRGRIVNIHPSLLPAFKGLAAWRQAVEAGAAESGCTVHWVTEDVDSGDIIAQARIPVLPDDTPESLHARIQVQEHILLPAVLEKIRRELRAGPV